MQPRWWMWIVALVTSVGLCAVFGCNSGTGPGPEFGPASPGPTTGPTTSPSVGKPVLVAKIDNSPQARPPVGLGAADSVYVEPVEGGLSRLAAVFSTHTPQVIGPIRSARETDLTLLAQFGQPTLVFSGAAPELVPYINRASLQNASAEQLPTSYFRDNSRAAPNNLFVRSDQLPEGSNWPIASQLHFGPAPADGQPSRHQEVRYPDTVIGFDWSPSENRWLVSMDGAPYTDGGGERIGASTVVLQSVQVDNSQFHDTAGSVSPLARTTGNGRALVLRDGRAFPASWARPSAEAGTNYTSPDGASIPFAPGQVWTVLVPAQ